MMATNDYQYIAEELARVSGVSYEEAVAAVSRVLADIAVRNNKSRHLCGLQGYNPMLGDTCPVCNP